MNLLQIHEPEEIKKEEQEIAVGIDLGTTNSLIAVIEDGKPKIIEDILPSIVSYIAGEVHVVGKRAGDISISSVKRLMGKTSIDIENLKDTYNIDITGVKLKVGNDKYLTAIEISAEILKKLKKQAEEYLGQEVKKAVITVPAYFDENAREATKFAAQLAGLETLRLLSEPTAASISYELDHGAEGIYIVYDFGGGTFDVSVLKMQKGVFKVLSVGGDNLLGGDDIDRILAQELFVSSDENSILKAKAIKEGLNSLEQIDPEASPEDDILQHVEQDLIDHIISHQKFEELIDPIVEKTISITRQTIKDAGINAKDIKEIILVGGSTKINYIRRKIKEAFAIEPLCSIDPDRIVAYGAAIQAYNLTHGSGSLLLDVIPLSLGLETFGGLFEKIIPRNSIIPTSVTTEFTTYKDNQTGMKINIFQGEREFVKDCRNLGEFELKNIPPMPPGAAKVAITFTIDADGLLTVTAEEKNTGEKQQIEVKPSYGISYEEMEEMIRNAILHAEEDDQKRSLEEKRVEAIALRDVTIKSITEDKDLLTDEEYIILQEKLQALEKAINGSDKKELDIISKQIEQAAEKFVERKLDKHFAHLKGIKI